MMGMHLKIADAEIAGNDVPDFMQIAGVRELPALWVPFASPFVTLVAIVVIPAGIAALLGLGVFKRKVKGAYFAILSQALAAAMAILLIGQAELLGGSNGLNGFRTFSASGWPTRSTSRCSTSSPRPRCWPSSHWYAN